MIKMSNNRKYNDYLNDKGFRELFPEAVLSYAYVTKKETGESFVYQGEKIHNLYYLLKGRCSVHTFLSNGKKMILSNVSAPALIGEIELLDLDNASFSVKTLEECTMIVCPLAQCRDILLNDNKFLRKLCSMIARKEGNNARRLIYSSGFPLDIRLADFILNNSEGKVFRIKKVEIAEILGASYRHIETLMSDFVKKGLLKKEKLTYYINNERILRQMADQLKEE